MEINEKGDCNFIKKEKKEEVKEEEKKEESVPDPLSYQFKTSTMFKKF